MKKRVIYLFLIISLILIGIILISLIRATLISDDLHLNIQTTDSSGDVVTGTFDFVFNISTTSDCANVIYSNLTTLTTDSRGIISYYLPNVTLDYDVQYWLCYYRDGVLINNSKIARSPYTFRARNITLSGVEVDANLDMGSYNITIGGGWLNNGVSIINGNIFAQVGYFYNITSLNVTKQNLTVIDDLIVDGRVGIGTTSPQKLLHLSGSSPIIEFTDTNTGADSYISTDNNAGGIVINADSNNEVANSFIDFGVDDIPAFYIQAGGNIGINTTTPQNTLNVIGAVNATSFIGDGSLLTAIAGGLGGVKIGSGTRSSAGTQTITGVGFKPKLVIFLGAHTAPYAGSTSTGYDDGVTHHCFYLDLGYQPARNYESYSYSIYVRDTVGGNMKGKITSMNDDGFTITWTRVPGVNTVFSYLALE